MPGRTALIVSVALVAVAGACSSPAGSTRPALPGSTATSAGASPTAEPTATATPVSSPPTAMRTLPPHSVAIEPDEYGWDRFEPAVSFRLDAGWSIGHDHDEFFDLFRGDDFPAVAFGRFTDVYTGPTRFVPITDAATVVASLGVYRGITVTDVAPTAIAGLRGQRLDLRVSIEQSALFRGAGGTFHLDPGFAVRYHVLDLPGGGVLLVGIMAHEGGLEAAIEAATPILSSLTVRP